MADNYKESWETEKQANTELSHQINAQKLRADRLEEDYEYRLHFKLKEKEQEFNEKVKYKQTEIDTLQKLYKEVMDRNQELEEERRQWKV